MLSVYAQCLYCVSMLSVIYAECLYAECLYAESIMVSVIMLDVFMLSVVAPSFWTSLKVTFRASKKLKYHNIVEKIEVITVKRLQV
jgi:hypothetical protein